MNRRTTAALLALAAASALPACSAHPPSTDTRSYTTPFRPDPATNAYVDPRYQRGSDPHITRPQTPAHQQAATTHRPPRNTPSAPHLHQQASAVRSSDTQLADAFRERSTRSRQHASAETIPAARTFEPTTTDTTTNAPNTAADRATLPHALSQARELYRRADQLQHTLDLGAHEDKAALAEQHHTQTIEQARFFHDFANSLEHNASREIDNRLQAAKRFLNQARTTFTASLANAQHLQDAGSHDRAQQAIEQATQTFAAQQHEHERMLADIDRERELVTNQLRRLRDEALRITQTADAELQRVRAATAQATQQTRQQIYALREQAHNLTRQTQTLPTTTITTVPTDN